jgi:hypothetical protein
MERNNARFNRGDLVLSYARFKELIGNGTKETDDLIEFLLRETKVESNTEYIQKKLDFILGSAIVSNFPNVTPDKEWVGAVIDLLEAIRLYDPSQK